VFEPATVRCQRCDGVIALLDAFRCENFCALTQPAQILCGICARHHTACGCWVEGPLALVWGSPGDGAQQP
jgi:hypothetical protein